MAKRKRTMSAKQKAALAKGRAALKRFHAGKKRTTRKKVARKHTTKRVHQPIIITEGEIMAGKKRRTSRRKATRKARRMSGVKTRTRYVTRHAKRRTRRHARLGGIGKLNVMETVTDVAGLAAGAIGASYVAKMVPVKNAKIQALIPLALGIGLEMTKFGRGKMGKAVAGGAIAVGTLSLVKQFFPTMPLLSGAEDAESVAGAIDALPDEERAMLGLSVQGAYEDGMSGEGETEYYGVDAPLNPSNVD